MSPEATEKLDVTVEAPTLEVAEPEPPTSTSFDITVASVNSNWAVILDPKGIITPRLVNVDQPQQFVQAFVDIAGNAVRVLSSQGSIVWGLGTWRISIAKVEQ